jgi:hypothetical protein
MALFMKHFRRPSRDPKAAKVFDDLVVDVAADAVRAAADHDADLAAVELARRCALFDAAYAELPYLARVAAAERARRGHAMRAWYAQFPGGATPRGDVAATPRGDVAATPSNGAADGGARDDAERKRHMTYGELEFAGVAKILAALRAARWRPLPAPPRAGAPPSDAAAPRASAGGAPISGEQVASSGVFVDLGSGAGRAVLAAACLQVRAVARASARWYGGLRCAAAVLHGSRSIWWSAWNFSTVLTRSRSRWVAWRGPDCHGIACSCWGVFALAVRGIVPQCMLPSI